MRKNVEDLRHTFNSLYEELKNRNIIHHGNGESKPMYYIAKGQMYRGLYGRRQSEIIEELRTRKVRKLELDNEQISPYFDRLHWEMSIIVITELLKRIDEKTDNNGRIYANSSYFLEYTRDCAAHLREGFKNIMGKTPYEDLLDLIENKHKEERKEKEEKMHEYLVKAYHNNFDKTKYARNNPFECEVKSPVVNIKVYPKTPKKTTIIKEEVVGVMTSLFGEEVEIVARRRVPVEPKNDPKTEK